jgi:hypothetical protein
VQAYADFSRELVWGALTIVNGSVYLGTASYCDRKMVGKLIRVQIATRAVSRWVSVPSSLGGGGGVWGWGGLGYSSRRGSIYVSTANAFKGGANRGKRFREWAGYGEHLVELSPSLNVRAANHPKAINEPLDLDFVGSPVVFRHPICGELVGALNKDGWLYVWRARKIAAGTLFSLHLASSPTPSPLLTQMAYSPLTGALYVSTPSKLVRVDIDGRCRGRVKWGQPVGSGLFNGSPTVAGSTVWLAENANGGSALLGFDVRTGAKRFRARLAGPTYVAPTVVGDRLYIPTFIGGVQGFALAGRLGRAVGSGASDLPEHQSFVDALSGWASHEDGLYATEDAGHTWQRIYPRHAIRVARVTAASGLASFGDRVTVCGCKQVRLWTADGGATWHKTKEGVGTGFTGAAATLWWWRGGALYKAVSWPPGRRGIRRKFVTRMKGAIVDAKPTAEGIVVLVTNRVGGLGLDNEPRLLFVEHGKRRVVSLPKAPGDVLVRSLEVAWPQITVNAADVTGFARGFEGVVTWTSNDGGATWSVEKT